MDALLEDFVACLDALERDGQGPVWLRRLLQAVPAPLVDQWRGAMLHGAPQLPDPQGNPERLALVLGVDAALAHCAPDRKAVAEAVPEGLRTLSRCYLDKGWLWRSSTGALLLPRRCRYGRPRDEEQVADLCQHVIRVPPEVAKRVRIEWVPPGCDHPAGTGPDLTLAASPFMVPGDLEVAPVSDTGAEYYRLAPRAERLRPVVDHLLGSLDGLDADVYLLPEGALDPALLAHWCDRLDADRGRAARIPRWLMLGSGPFPFGDSEPPTNRAVLLHAATGKPLLEHDKRLPFKLTDEQVRTWNLADPAPAHDLDGLGPVARGEFISTGTGPVTVLESQAGRFGVLVCEDMARTPQPPTTDLIAVGVSHLLVPVFAKEIRQYFWEDQSAAHYVLEAGTRVAVVNSLVVPRLDDDRDGDEVNFLLLCPMEGEPWGRLLSASSPTEVVEGALTGP